jgi:hypothetical protein
LTSKGLLLSNLADLRQEYIFATHAPPFPILVDLLDAIHPNVRTAIHHAALERAMALSNLATFVWVILRPDECWSLIDEVAEEVDERPSKRSSRATAKGKERAMADQLDAEQEQLRARVRRRNEILRKAWKNWWMVVVPREKRSQVMARLMWLEMLTQVKDQEQTSV